MGREDLLAEFEASLERKESVLTPSQAGAVHRRRHFAHPELARKVDLRFIDAAIASAGTCRCTFARRFALTAL